MAVVGDASFNVSADLSSFVRSLGQAEAVFKKFADSISGLDVDLLGDDFADTVNEAAAALTDLHEKAQGPGIKKLIEDLDEANPKMRRVTADMREATKAWEESFSAGVSDEAVEELIRLGKKLDEAGNEIGDLRNEMGSLRGAFPVDEVIPSDFVRQRIKNIRDDIDRLKKDFATPFSGGAFAAQLDDISRLEAGIAKLERQLQNVGKIPPDGANRLREMRAELDRLREAANIQPIRIPLSFETREAIRQTEAIDVALREIERDIVAIRQASARGLLDTNQARQQVAVLLKQYRELGGAVTVNTLGLPFRKMSDEAIAAEKSIIELKRHVTDLQRLASQELMGKFAAGQQIQAANEQIRVLGGTTKRASLEIRNNTQEALANANAIRQLQSWYNHINKTLTQSAIKTAALSALQAQAKALGGNLEASLSRVGGAAAKAAGGMNFMERAGSKVDNVLKGFGLTMRDLNVIIGSGFLSTAGPALAVLLGVAIVGAATKAAIAMAKLGDQLLTFRARLEAGFGESARIIQEFSQTMATRFGLSEIAAIKLTGTIGNLFKSFGVGNQAAAEFAVDLAEAAHIIQKTSFTADTYEQVLQKLQGALTGNIEALREYGIAVNETTLRNTAQAHGIRLVGGEIDAATKALLAQLFIYDQAQARQGAYAESTESLASASEQLTAEFQNLQAELGTHLVPAFLEIVKKGSEFLQLVNESIAGFSRWSEENKHAADGLNLLSQAMIPITNPQTWKLTGGALEAIIKSAKALGEAFQWAVEQFNRFAELIPGLDSESEKAAKAAEEAGERIRKAFDLEKEDGGLFPDVSKGSLGLFIDQLERLGKISAGSGVEGLKDFGDVLNEQLKRFKEGKITATEFFNILSGMTDLTPEELQQAFKEQFDNLVKLHPELEKYRDDLVGIRFEEAKAVEEAKKLQEARMKDPKILKQILDAYENLNDVIEENAERLRDARDAVKEAREERIKQVADAEEAVRDARLEGTKRVADAEEALAEAREDRNKAIKDARRSLRDAEEDAVEAIADAEENLRDARIDAAEKVDDAERKLADARRQRSDAILDAQISLEQALRQGDVFAERQAQLSLSRAKGSEGVEEALRSLDEARIESRKQVAEAQEKLTETIEEQNERVREAEERLAEVIEEQTERVIEAKERLAEARVEAVERILEAEEKLREVDEKTQERLDEAKEKVKEVKEENEERLNEAIEKVKELEGSWDDVNAEVERLIKNIDKLRAKHADLFPPPTAGGDLVIFNEHRQHGGPVTAGRPYWVGEGGLPELFVPNASGSVVSNEQIAEVLRQMAKNNGGTSQSIQVFDSGDPEATAFAVAHRLMAGVNN